MGWAERREISVAVLRLSRLAIIVATGSVLVSNYNGLAEIGEWILQGLHRILASVVPDVWSPSWLNRLSDNFPIHTEWIGALGIAGLALIPLSLLGFLWRLSARNPFDRDEPEMGLAGVGMLALLFAAQVSTSVGLSTIAAFTFLLSVGAFIHVRSKRIDAKHGMKWP